MQVAAAPLGDERLQDGSLRARIVALADQCVMCGLCQPYCPTYGVARHEAESPRGRIAIAKALALDAFAPDDVAGAVQHLDQCLACMGCERVCPSQVRYGELIVAARGLMRATHRPAAAERFLRILVESPTLLRALLRVANWPGVGRMLRSRAAEAVLRPFGLDRIARELPRLPRVLRSAQGAARQEASRGRIGIFLGCVAAAMDRDVHAGATRVLRALGYEPVMPQTQGCCGALALHAGDQSAAEKTFAPTRRAFATAGVDTVLVSASGCFGALRTAFAGSAIRVREIHEFLAADKRIDSLRPQPLKQRVALHTPCTQANVAGGADAVRKLLGRIPQLEIAALPDAPRCCGAAGDYFLRHPAIADALRTQKLDQIQTLAPSLLVTSNVGCRMFLDNGLRQRGGAARVLHPVALLAQQLEN